MSRKHQITASLAFIQEKKRQGPYVQSLVLEKQGREPFNTNIDFPIFLSDYEGESEGETVEKKDQAAISKFDSRNYGPNNQCCCPCHRSSHETVPNHLKTHFFKKIQKLHHEIDDLVAAKEQIKTQIQIQLENQKQILKLFSVRILKQINEAIPAIQRHSRLQYLNNLNQIQDYNLQLKDRIKKIENELKDYRSEYFMKKSEGSSSGCLRRSHPESIECVSREKMRIRARLNSSGLEMLEDAEKAKNLKEIEQLQSKINHARLMIEEHHSSIN